MSPRFAARVLGCDLTDSLTPLGERTAWAGRERAHRTECNERWANRRVRYALRKFGEPVVVRCGFEPYRIGPAFSIRFCAT